MVTAVDECGKDMDEAEGDGCEGEGGAALRALSIFLAATWASSSSAPLSSSLAPIQQRTPASIDIPAAQLPLWTQQLAMRAGKGPLEALAAQIQVTRAVLRGVTHSADVLTDSP